MAALVLPGETLSRRSGTRSDAPSEGRFEGRGTEAVIVGEAAISSAVVKTVRRGTEFRAEPQQSA